MRLVRVVSLLLVVFVPFAVPSFAGPYDVIFTDSLDVTLCQGCGITIAGMDYGLLVNTGFQDITLNDISAATFEVTSSPPDIVLTPFLNIPTSDFGPILPGEAVGSIQLGNEFLLSLLQPGETFRQAGGQFMGFNISRGFNTYEGPVQFNVRMVLAGHAAHFIIRGQAHLGSHDLRFFTGSRVSATPAGGAPNCAHAVSRPVTLSPANRQFVPIAIDGVTDPEGDPLTIVVTDVTQDEPVEKIHQPPPDSMIVAPVAAASSGRGFTAYRTAMPQRVTRKTCNDARIVNGQAEVKAERDNDGNGRVYALHYRAVDPLGNVCKGTVNVCVPGRDGSCVDDGQYYRSLEEVCPENVVSEPTDLIFQARMVGPRETELTFVLEEAAEIDLAVFDVAGRRLTTLERGPRSAGAAQARWSSAAVPAGVYFARLGVDGRVLSRPIVVR